MIKVSKNGVVRNQTERTMMELLHGDVDAFRPSHAFMRRNTPNARAALARWETDGVLETTQDRYSPHSTYTYTAYRLAPAWRDAELMDTNLVSEDAALTQKEAASINRLHKAETELAAAWERIRHLAGTLERVHDGDLEWAHETLTVVSRAVSARRSAVAIRDSLARDRAAMDARLAARGPVATAMSSTDEGDMVGAMSAAMSDPLGGDA